MVCSGSALLTPLIVTRLMAMPFSLLSQIGFCSKSVKALLASPSKLLSRSFRILLIPSSRTLSIDFSSLKLSGVISFLIEKSVSNQTSLTFSGSCCVCASSKYIGVFANAFLPVKAFLGSPPFSSNRLVNSLLYKGFATLSMVCKSNLEPIFSSFCT